MTPSPQQQAICDFVAGNVQNLLVRAAPGSGKTTTIAMASRELRPDGVHLALAFNRHTADAFTSKLPYFVRSSTMHSLCKRAIELSLAKPPHVDLKKTERLLKDILPDFSVRRQVENDVKKLTSLMKQFKEEISVEQLAIDFGIEPLTEVCQTAVSLFEASESDTAHMDFDDMLRWAALWPTVAFQPAKTCFLDEAQDTNEIQLVVLRKLNCRVIAVGDEYQSIYGFRGASHTAMDDIKTAFSCEELPLSVSYRCSRAVVEEARRVLERYTPRPLSDNSPLSDSVVSSGYYGEQEL